MKGALGCGAGPWPVSSAVRIRTAEALPGYSYGVTIRAVMVCASVLCGAANVSAQADTPAAETRAGKIAAEQQEKAKDLKPYAPNKAERWVKELEETFLSGQFRWHPFFESAYRGGGFTLGAGYLAPVGDYETVDVRGSWTPAGYLRFESEFRAPRLFDRRGTLSVIGGWRKATEVGYFGLGTDNTSRDDKALYSFTQPYASATLDVRPWRHWLVLTGATRLLRMAHRTRLGVRVHRSKRSTRPTPLRVSARHRPTCTARAPSLSIRGRRPATSGGAATTRCRCMAMSTTTTSTASGSVDYEAIQHVPLGRDRWVLSLRGKVETTDTADDGRCCRTS